MMMRVLHPQNSQLDIALDAERWVAVLGGRDQILGDTTSHLRPPVKLGLPCSGRMDGAGAALEELLGPHGFRIAWAWDVCNDVSSGLRRRTTTRSLHVGPTAGDFNSVTVESLEVVDIIMAGVPCQPDSIIGHRRKRADPRAEVALKVLATIEYQSTRGLKAFILENVKAIAEGKDHSDGFLNQLRNWARTAMGGFDIRTFFVNSKEQGGIPQSRGRVYFVGVAKSVLRAAEMEMPSYIPPMPCKALRSYLDLSAPRLREEDLCVAFRTNILLFKQALSRDLADPNREHEVACFNVDRKLGGFNGGITIGYVPCVTCTDNQMFVLGLGEGKQPMLHRYLTTEEKAALQGFQENDIRDLSSRELLRGVGEAFTVPIAGRVLCIALRPIYAERRAGC